MQKELSFENVKDLYTPLKGGGKAIVYNGTAESNPFYGICKDALRAYHFCNRIGLPINSLDLNHSNIMKREDGTLVLSDPFGSRDI